MFGSLILILKSGKHFLNEESCVANWILGQFEFVVAVCHNLNHSLSIHKVAEVLLN